jgi:hypothetical protein
MVDDDVGHHVSARGKGRDVIPRSKAPIDLGVVDRIESRVCAIDGMEEGQQVHATEGTAQRPVEQVLQIAKGPARHAIDVARSVAPDSSSARRKGIIQGRTEAWT